MTTVGKPPPPTPKTVIVATSPLRSSTVALPVYSTSLDPINPDLANLHLQRTRDDPGASTTLMMYQPLAGPYNVKLLSTQTAGSPTRVKHPGPTAGVAVGGGVGVGDGGGGAPQA